MVNPVHLYTKLNILIIFRTESPKFIKMRHFPYRIVVCVHVGTFPAFLSLFFWTKLFMIHQHSLLMWPWTTLGGCKPPPPILFDVFGVRKIYSVRLFTYRNEEPNKEDLPREFHIVVNVVQRSVSQSSASSLLLLVNILIISLLKVFNYYCFVQKVKRSICLHFWDTTKRGSFYKPHNLSNRRNLESRSSVSSCPYASCDFLNWQDNE